MISAFPEIRKSRKPLIAMKMPEGPDQEEAAYRFEVGKRLAEVREAIGDTQAQFAERLYRLLHVRLHVSAISNFENGKSPVPTRWMPTIAALHPDANKRDARWLAWGERTPQVGQKGRAATTLPGIPLDPGAPVDLDEEARRQRAAEAEDRAGRVVGGIETGGPPPSAPSKRGPRRK